MLLKEKEVVVVEVAKKVPEPQPKKDTTQNKAKVIEAEKVVALVTKVAEKKEEFKLEIPKVEAKQVRSASSSSSESVESMKDKLIRQISESISSYSLEKANETAGVISTPKRSVPNSPLASSISNSIHTSPIKAQPAPAP